MKIYTDVYSWSVIDEIQKGNNVYVVDRLKALVHCANTMVAEDLLWMIFSEEKGRYAFWKVEEEDLDD